MNKLFDHKGRGAASQLLALSLCCIMLFGAPAPVRADAEGPANPDPDGNGVVTSKTVKANEDGTYTITLETYTTGKVTSVERTVPVDTVLVLDQSGSMAAGFDGGSVSYADSRQKAMKEAVDGFIDNVAEKYSDEADHRISIVTFGSDAEVLQDWTFVDPAGRQTLKDKIDGLPEKPEGATNTAAGMRLAEKQMGEDYDYSGQNPKREKVVIVFTDGVPTTSSEFDINVADGAIASAYNLKKDAEDKGLGCTVYSVGIFNGADPDELYGASGFEQNCDGTVGSKWVTNAEFMKWGSGYMLISVDKDPEPPAANRFMNYLSSNYKEPQNVGLKIYQQVTGGGSGFLPGLYGFEITDNYGRTAQEGKNYYLSAGDAEGLNNIFESISEEISAPDVKLGPETVVTDIVTPCFTAPDDAKVKIYTSDYKGGNEWEPCEDAAKVTHSVTGRILNVTGFDYAANFVSETPKPGTSADRGKKLIVEFTVRPEPKFLGGNNVPTNGEGSRIHNEEEEVSEDFGHPKVNVPIKELKVTAEDKNVYLTGDVTTAEMKNGAEAAAKRRDWEGEEGDIVLDLDKENYGLQPWQYEFVTITTSTSDAKTGLLNDDNYDVSVAITPKYDGDGAQGAANPAAGESGTVNKKIFVFKPELTFKDSIVNFGTDLDEYDYGTNDFVKKEWKHGETPDTAVTMTGTEPILDLTYLPDPNDTGKLTDDKKVDTVEDIPVRVAVKTGETEVNQYTTFIHDECNVEDCGWDELNETNYGGTVDKVHGSPAFLLHIPTTKVTVTKSVTGSLADKSKTFKFTVSSDDQLVQAVIKLMNENDLTFELKDGGEKKIKVPVGVAFKVTEENYQDKGYTTTFQMGDTSGGNEAAVSGANGQRIAFTNKKDAKADTGISLDFLPYISILIFVTFGGAALFFLIRRRFGS